jgi:hypothetical protein
VLEDRLRRAWLNHLVDSMMLTRDVHFRWARLGVALGLVLALAACGESKPVYNSDYQDPRLFKPDGGIFGRGGSILGGNKPEEGTGTGIGVNAFLWRSSLETLSFMPLASADPFGGVIITDWYQPPAGTGERFKATAYILGRQLRADGIKVAIYRQVLQGGQWVDAPVSPATVSTIEDKILAKARELRAEVAGNS